MTAERLHTPYRKRRSPRSDIAWHLLTGTLVNGGILIMLLFMMLPFLWMLSTALKDPITVLAVPPVWVPWPLNTQSFSNLLDAVAFFGFYKNSFIVAGSITIGQLVFCSSAAFAFARLRFPGRDLAFGVYLCSLLVPEQVTIIPLFLIMKQLGLLDSLPSLIIPALTSAFGTFLLRQFFLSIPSELDDAARVDGAGPFRILTTIYIPLSGAALAALAIFTFNGYWNEFFRPLIFLTDQAVFTIPLGLNVVLGQYQTNQAEVMAAATLAVAPVLVLYVFAQRYIVEGITLSGLKG